MTGPDKLQLLNRLKLRYQSMAMQEGDAHPMVNVEIVDTDVPEAFVQLTMAFRVPLSTYEKKKQ